MKWHRDLAFAFYYLVILSQCPGAEKVKSMSLKVVNSCDGIFAFDDPDGES